MDKKHILIVDDYEGILNIHKEILESEGYWIDTAMTGREAIEKSREQFFDLALLDIKLPDMDGVELLERLRWETPKTVNVMITGIASKEKVMKSLNLGAEAFLLKPVNPEEMIRIVHEKLKA